MKVTSQPRIYLADSMAEALAQVKRELGRDAVILRTRTIRDGGLWGVGTRNRVEITAAGNNSSLQTRQTPDSIRQARDVHFSKAALDAKGVAVSAAGTAQAPSLDVVVRQELQDIRSLLLNLVHRRRGETESSTPAALRPFYQRLIENDVAEELADRLIEDVRRSVPESQWNDASRIQDCLVQRLAAKLSPAYPICLSDRAGQCKVVALVGPTGVGKTTTAAKLAAHFSLHEKKRVGLITIDTYRMAAVEQIRTYARILRIPLEVVMTPDDLKPALDRLQNCDLVIVDTVGRSQMDDSRLMEMKRFLDVVRPDETHLVLPAQSAQAVLFKTVEQFSKLGVNRIIFSKLDEAVGIGTMFHVLQRVAVKLSYVTTGQNVPDDIEPGDGRQIARWILDGVRKSTAEVPESVR